MTNALRHTPAGTPIEVGVRLEDGAAVVSVRDHGRGLAPEALAHVFDRFWQADEARVRSGAGLGLAIVSSVAAEHGGTTTVANAPDGGAILHHSPAAERVADDHPDATRDPAPRQSRRRFGGRSKRPLSLPPDPGSMTTTTLAPPQLDRPGPEPARSGTAEKLEWISAARFHPINLFFGSILADVFLLIIGISPNIFLVLGPINIAHSAFVHANLDWALGPFKYVIASPVFHRWHHTASDRGGEKNFAGTFPVFDLLFGTFYMPAGELPDHYGIADREFPTTFGAQLVHPFTK